MKPHWHETIQQYVDGQSSVEDAATLRKGLSEDAELRALYLDYMNLDVALAAMADGTVVEENGSNRITSLDEARTETPRQYWRWAAAAAALAAMVVIAVLPKAPKPLGTSQDVTAAITSSQGAIAQLSFDITSALPAWMSPTASLLEPTKVPQ
jgi:anti-sigma factor RsiW